ncbi:hypothetical protein BCR41DRAFT_387012 [Lobosporangium transversale]|uniref:Uncharacterized protein n=1 Tax=Lobosporangium transversale TaxID=64571 RepID=A0A1Y2GKD1_9FUNG|nr:hypothetical protein BCR41DRAFT_387010 [Lobosporangium transversale]XP_021880549.1 hypothetical protein BCR41DRAFT_387012 [Lobosporangium transversale]ORZ13763.1 hypothetical protein BCR41DRAFT_387010 [Lobosporangium transversale]ORZ13765.1 hypothetical protein BCR41DRAFT_387012 [Lobosporangium transversale]|eukprot:XP_021880547.1 hypothetical protein BCR41DRAFT_387010 [Lobosporangium transversale]
MAMQMMGQEMIGKNEASDLGVCVGPIKKRHPVCQKGKRIAMASFIKDERLQNSFHLIDIRLFSSCLNLGDPPAYAVLMCCFNILTIVDNELLNLKLDVYAAWDHETEECDIVTFLRSLIGFSSSRIQYYYRLSP